MAAVAIFAMSACNNETDEQAPQKGKQPVQFQMTMSGSTRTTTGTDASRITEWAEGDSVGIFVYKQGESTNPVATNAKYVLTGDKWIAAVGSEIYAEEAYDYYAYYPYQADVTDPTQISVSAMADQSTVNGADYGKSDILASQNKSVAAGALSVPLLFKHMFAMVEVKVEGDKVSKQPTKAILKGVKLDATLNIMAATPSATPKLEATAKDVTMYYLTKTTDAGKAPFSFRAVVPAQEIAAGTPLVAIYAPDTENKTYTMQHSAAVTYEAGKFRQLVVSIGTAKVSLTIPKGDLTINPWEESTGVPGTGEEGAVTSVIPDIKAGINFTAKGIWAVDKVTDANSYWFHRENTAGATTVTIDETDGAALALTLGASDKGSWNNSCIGYHFYGKLEQATYKVTMTMKSDIASGIVGITVSSSKDDKMFKMLTDKLADWVRNVTTFGSLDTTWLTKTFYIDTTSASTEGKSSSLSSLAPTTDADVNGGINIVLYNYSTGASTVYIKDLKVEKYTATP